MTEEARHDASTRRRDPSPAIDRTTSTPGNRPEEQIGRALGRLFGRLKRTETWRRSEQAYRDALTGKDEQSDSRPPGR